MLAKGAPGIDLYHYPKSNMSFGEQITIWRRASASTIPLFQHKLNSDVYAFAWWHVNYYVSNDMMGTDREKDIQTEYDRETNSRKEKLNVVVILMRNQFTRMLHQMMYIRFHTLINLPLSNNFLYDIMAQNPSWHFVIVFSPKTHHSSFNKPAT